MFKGFDLSLKFVNDNYYQLGLKSYEDDKRQISQTIDTFKLLNGNIDGSKMQANWFPQIDADIFISHSHNDRILAITLAGWLKERFKIKTFIDSCIWGYAVDLNKLLDNKFSWLDEEKGIYEYNKVMYSTSHVHMMLSTALTMMIDRTECIIFLNTPNSITPNESIKQTASPWIYSELAITKLVRIKAADEHRKALLKAFSGGGRVMDESLEIRYRVDTEHLIKLTLKDLNDWSNAFTNEIYPLDVLYKKKLPLQRING